MTSETASGGATPRRFASAPAASVSTIEGHTPMADYLDLLAIGPTGWGDEILAGAWLTISLALATLPFGLVLGFLVALAKRSNSALLRGFGETFSTVFRGLPELLTIFIVYFGGQILLQAVVQLFSSEATVEANGFIAGMLALGIGLRRLCQRGLHRRIQRHSTRAMGGRSRDRPAPDADDAARHRAAADPPRSPGLANLWLMLMKDTALRLGHRPERPAAHDLRRRRHYQAAFLLLFRRVPALPPDVDRLVVRHRGNRSLG